LIGLIDFGGGNQASVEGALRHLAVEFRRVRTAHEVDGVDAVIFPGVGAAEPAMASLRAGGIDRALIDFIGSGRPYLGICLGLQLLFEHSTEDGATCLGVLEGEVVRVPTREKLPHVGWNTVRFAGPSALLAEEDGSYFYFTHSYAARPDDPRLVWGTTEYGESWASAIAEPPVFGVQFHPERSGDAGLSLLAAFCGPDSDGPSLAG
jgi:glutamine amidotransferase